MVLDPRDLLRPRMGTDTTAAVSGDGVAVPLGGTRQERLQRLQVGGFGILAMVLVIALADIVNTRAQETQANAVPEAAPTIAASEASTPSDPLVDAGVSPELPPEPVAEPDFEADQTGDVPPPASVQNAPLQ